MGRTDVRHDIRELLNCCDNNALSILNCFTQITGMFSPSHSICHLHKLLDVITNLLVQNTTVGNNQYGVNHRMTVLLQSNQLVGQPRDRIRLTGASTVLNQITLADTVFLYISQQFFHAIQLVITREYLLYRLLLCFWVLFNNNLRIIFNDATELQLGKNVLPKIVCHQAIWIRRITGTIIVAFIKRQEPAVLTVQLCAEFDSCVVNGKMHHAAFELEQQLSWVTIGLVLLNRIVHILLCELILQLKSDDRQAIDE